MPKLEQEVYGLHGGSIEPECFEAEEEGEEEKKEKDDSGDEEEEEEKQEEID